MEQKDCIISWVFMLLCVFCTVDFVKASVVTTEKRLTEKTFSKVHFKTPLMRADHLHTSSQRRRSIKEKGDRQLDVCADIIGPKWQNMTKKETSACPSLIVRVPKAVFPEFVKINERSEVEDGFSIAVLCHALQLLPFKVQPIFVPFVNQSGGSNGTYDELLKQIEGKKCEVVAGDVTIRGTRAQNVDFTSPYMSSEINMLVRATHTWNQTLWTFLRPFTWRLWLTIVGACIFIGLAVAILEYRVGNPKFMSPFYQKLIMVIWFPISTFFFHEGKILNRCSKVVLVMWLSMIFIVVQIFTACLSSWLTLDQLRPKLPTNLENVGYQDGSFVQEFVMQQSNCTSNRLLPLKSIDEFKNALSNGSVNAIVDESPYIEIFIAKYGSEYMKFGPIIQESGLAFALPRGSSCLRDFSRAVINVTESENMVELKKKYLGFSTPSKEQYNQALPQSLDVRSFIGLFIFMGSVTIAAIISSEISLMRRKDAILPLTSMSK